MPKGSKSYNIGGGSESVICPCGYVAVGRTEANTKITMRLHRRFCNALDLPTETIDDQLTKIMKAREEIASRMGRIMTTTYRRVVEESLPTKKVEKKEPKKKEPKKIEPKEHTEYVEETSETFYGIYAKK